MKQRLKRLIPIAVLALLIAGCNSDEVNEDGASEWKPEKPVEMVAPARAGGGWDTFARVVSNAIMEQELMEQNIGVINKLVEQVLLAGLHSKCK